MDIAYYPGCTLKESSSLYDLQTRTIFNELGTHLLEIKDWSCCGATSAGKVDDFLAVGMPARNLGIAEATGLSEMVIPCSACYSRTLVAQQRLADDEHLRKEINGELLQKVNGRIKVSSILEVLTDRTKTGELAARITHKFKGLRPVCYYGCLMTRFPYAVDVPDNVENPQAMERILEAIGIHAVDWNCKTSCCGASAAVNDPKTGFKLMSKIMQDALDPGADCIVTTCPMCQLNMDANQDEFCQTAGIGARLPVFFLTELLGAAMGLDPAALQADQHFIDGTHLLKELEPI
jgi:heterodisulfide reductase subunit B